MPRSAPGSGLGDLPQFRLLVLAHVFPAVSSRLRWHLEVSHASAMPIIEPLPDHASRSLPGCSRLGRQRPLCACQTSAGLFRGWSAYLPPDRLLRNSVASRSGSDQKRLGITTGQARREKTR